MPSERPDRRLHPVSILFGLGKQMRTLAIPALLVLVTAGARDWSWSWSDWWSWETWQSWEDGGSWEAWPLFMLPFLIPYALVSLGRYLTLRYRYEPNELVIRTGRLSRNERHVPYARIQNLDAVQNVFHRLLDVVEVRVETGGGKKPEATLAVLPVAAFEEMQRRVFAGREGASAPAEISAVPAAAPGATGRTLLRLPARELAICGLIQNRGMVVIAAAFGLLWELGLANRLFDGVAGEEVEGRGVVRDLVAAVLGQGGFPMDRIALALAALAGFLLLVQILSVGLALVRLHGFRLTRDGEDLRTEYGLLTRVVASVPLRRIQSLTILEGPLHQFLRRASIRVETAGGNEGGDGENKRKRELLAPVVRSAAAPDLVRELLPEVGLAMAAWNPVHPRAFRREVKGWLPLALASAPVFGNVGAVAGFAVLAGTLALGVLGARMQVARLGWAVTDDAVLFRSGWLWKKLTVVPFQKIQAVTVHESPRDRRAAMARVRVDTAGAGERSHRVDVPYLARETARLLGDLLATQAARTAFRW